METITRQIKCLRCDCSIQTNKDILNRFHQIRPYPSRIPIFIEPLQPAMFELPDHQLTP